MNWDSNLQYIIATQIWILYLILLNRFIRYLIASISKKTNFQFLAWKKGKQKNDKNGKNRECRFGYIGDRRFFWSSGWSSQQDVPFPIARISPVGSGSQDPPLALMARSIYINGGWTSFTSSLGSSYCFSFHTEKSSFPWFSFPSTLHRLNLYPPWTRWSDFSTFI